MQEILFSKQLGDSYTVYYTDKGVDHTVNDGRGTSLDEAADFIANRFIGLVEDKIMGKKLEARIERLEGMLFNKTVKSEAASLYDGYSVNDKIQAYKTTDWDYSYKAVLVDIGELNYLKKKYPNIEDFIYNWYLEDGNVSKMACVVKIVDDKFGDYDDFDYDKNVLYLWPFECISHDYSDVDRAVNNYYDEAINKLKEAIKFVKSLPVNENNREHYRRLIKGLDYLIDLLKDHWD